MNGSPTKSKGRTPRPEMKSIRPRKVVTKAKRAAKTVSGVHGRDKKATKASGETSLHSEPSAVPSAAKETADENTLRVCSNVQDARPLDTHSADENADERARSSIESLQEIEFRALLEEASARVIQMYWRRHRSHKKMESETLSDKRRASTKGTLQSSQEPNLVSNQTASGEDLAAEKSEHIAIAEGKALKVLETVRASVGPFPDEVSTRDRYEDVENVEPTSSDGDCGSARDPRPRSCGFLFESDFMCRERNGESIPSESCRNEKRSLRVEASLCTHSQKQCWRDGGTHDLSTGEPTAIERRVPVDENTPCIGVQKRSGKSRDQFRASEKVESIMNLLKRAERQEIPSDACSYRAAFVSDTSGSSSSNHADDTVSTSGSVGGFSAKSSGVKSTQLAESIYDGFKSKVQSLRKELEGRDARIVRLTQDLENAQAQHRNRLEELKQSQAKSLEQQKVMQEADLRQRLEFIDALLVDKDKLSLECEKLSAEVKEQQNQHEKEVEALKHRWSDELKRQRETWQASEKSKRDQWQAQKKKEIAEMTAKAMEPKFVQMAENYTSEVNRLKDKISTQERLLEEHERHSMQLRDRLMKEREDAVEKERVTAHARLMQEKEKHKMEIESVMDKAGTDVEREKRSAATRIEELQKRHQEELTNEIRRWEEEARKGKIEVEREKAAVEQNHSKALSRVREECGAEREGWKEAIRERAERQMRSELEKRKKLLEQERDEEIQVVLMRLEEEKRALREEIQEKDSKFSAERQVAGQAFAKREAAAEARVSSAEEGQRASRENAERMQQHAAELSKELDRRAETIKWLESQVSKIRQESLDREADLSRRFSNKEAGMKVEMETVAQERASLCNKEKAAKQQVSNLKRHHQAELSRVEVRVKETLLAKDAKINTLQEEINGKQAEIENLKRTLLKHKQELDI